MSDFEINGMIAESTQKFGDYTQARGLTFIHEYGDPVGEFGTLCLGWKEFDPCNSWADAGTIIEANKIAMIPESDGTWFALGNPQIKSNWRVESTGPFITTRHDTTPLRAAMIVFLMMQEEK